MHVTVTQEDEQHVRNPYQVFHSEKSKARERYDPIAWLERNSGNKWAETQNSGTVLGGMKGLIPTTFSMGHEKPKAALISLVRNSELDGIVQSMTQLEWRWNRKYNYPWIFFNDEEFSEEFKVWEVPSLIYIVTVLTIAAGSYLKPYSRTLLL